MRSSAVVIEVKEVHKIIYPVNCRKQPSSSFKVTATRSPGFQRTKVRSYISTRMVVLSAIIVTMAVRCG